MASHWECPLCLELFEQACETSCGHAFCAKCILQVWHTGGKDKPIKCPIDRRLVSMLIPSYVLRAEVSAQRSARRESETIQDQTALERHDAEIDEYNYKFARAPRDLTQQMQEDWVLLSRLFSGRFSVYKPLVVVTLLIAVLYVVSPVDLLPDSMGLVGLLDDLVVLIVCVWMVIAFIEGYRVQLLQRI